MRSLKNICCGFLASTLMYACNNETNASREKEAGSSHDKHNMAASSAGYADSVNSGLIAQDTLKGSPERTAMATIGKTHLHISYHSPGVKGRVIWGGLVPYGTVWVTGAHTATSIQINHPILIENKKVDTGTYAIFTIPGEKEWIFLLNKNYKQHLADDYAATEDVLRINTKPIANELTQRLTYAINKQSDESGNIEMKWEKIKVVIPFKSMQ